MNMELPEDLYQIMKKKSVACGDDVASVAVRFMRAGLNKRDTDADYYRKLKKKLIKERGKACQLCGETKRLVLHRKSKRYHLAEPDGNLLIVCRGCKTAYTNRSKSRALLPKDIPLIDEEGFGWLIEEIKQAHAKPAPSTTPAPARPAYVPPPEGIEESNLRFERQFAADLLEAMARLGAESISPWELVEVFYNGPIPLAEWMAMDDTARRGDRTKSYSRTEGQYLEMGRALLGSLCRDLDWQVEAVGDHSNINHWRFSPPAKENEDVDQ